MENSIHERRQMIGITNMPDCGFGNRIIYYYNLRQAAHKKNVDYFSIPWLGYHFFKGNILGKYPPNQNFDNFDFCLGDKFFEESGISTREVFSLKEKPLIKDNICAVHFRGTDFHAWNPKSILETQYYLDSIEFVKKEATSFVLFTDDINLESYKNVRKMLEDQKIEYFTGHNTPNRNNYIGDFAVMSECDYIVSSPSTFCISAGFIGKEKKIIHSKNWVESRIELKDKFWCDMIAAGGNKDYEIWRLI